MAWDRNHRNFLSLLPDYDVPSYHGPTTCSAARRLLEEEGWYDSDGTGIIDKMIDGK